MTTGRTEAFRERATQVRRVLRGLVTLGLITSLGCAGGCARHDAEQVASETPEQSAVRVAPGVVASQPVVFRVGRSVYANGVDGEPSTLLFTAEENLAGVFRFSPDGTTAYYVTAAPTGAQLWAADLAGGEHRVLAEGVIDIIRVTADGAIIALSEEGENPLELVRIDPETGDGEVLAALVGGAVCSDDGEVVAFERALDEVDPVSPGAIYVMRRDSEPVIVREVQETESASVLRVSPERLLFVVTAGDPYRGELFEYDITSGELTSIATDVGYLDSTEEMGRVVVEVSPEPGDPTISQVVLMTRTESGVWDMQAIGEPAADTVFGAEISDDGTHAVVIAATLGHGDAVRFYDLTSLRLTHEQSLDEGSAVSVVVVSGDARSAAYVTQVSPEGTEEGVARETLFSTGLDADTVTLVTTDLEAGGERLTPLAVGDPGRGASY